MKTELIKRAIESAQNRKYKLSKDLEHNISDLHRKKANGQREVMQVTIEALEKQIPKKPTEVNEIIDGTFYRMDFMCPSCDTANIENAYKPKYCKHCGQALDWSEEYEQTETNNQDS